MWEREERGKGFDSDAGRRVGKTLQRFFTSMQLTRKRQKKKKKKLGCDTFAAGNIEHALPDPQDREAGRKKRKKKKKKNPPISSPPLNINLVPQYALRDNERLKRRGGGGGGEGEGK